MFRIRSFVLVLVALVLSGSTAWAGSNVWAHGFPKTAKNGDILIKGTATADSGFTLGKTGTAVVWPAGKKGGVITSFSITVNTTTGAWSANLTGLSQNTSYVIVVQVPETMGSTTQTIASPPRTREVDRDDD